MSSIQPRGVHGTKISVSPRDNLPAVIVVNPSTSLFSEMYSVTFSPSIPRSWKIFRFLIDEISKPRKLRRYENMIGRKDRLIENPILNQEAVGG